MKRFALSAVIFVAVALLLWAGGVAPAAYNLVLNAGSALVSRSKLNFVNGGCVDNAGAQQTDCTAGNGGTVTYSGPSVTFTGTQFFPYAGGGPSSGTETVVSVGAPQAGTISNMFVRLSAAPGVGNTIAVTWRKATSSQTVTCSVTGNAATTCSDIADSFTVNQGDLINYQTVTTGTPGALTIVITSQYGIASSAPLTTSFTISNAGVTGTTTSTLTKFTGAPSTAVITATTDTGGAVGVTTAGAGTSGSATITTSGQVSCVFDGATTAGHYVQISSTVAGNCHDSGAAYPTTGQVIGRVISTNGGGGTFTLDLFPSEIKAGGAGGGGFIQTLTAPVSGSFTARNFNTGAGVVTTQTNASSPVTYITLLQHDPNGTNNIAALSKAVIAATFTVTVALSIPPSGSGNQSVVGLWLSDGGGGPNNLFFGAQNGVGLRIPIFTNFTTFSTDAISAFSLDVPTGPLAWFRIQETASNRIYFTSSDGSNWLQFFSESNVAHFTTAQYGVGIENRGSGATIPDAMVTWYSFTESNP